MIPYGRQDISEEDVAAVAAVLRSDWLTQGPAVPEFERAVARFCGARHAVAVNSGTSALHLACLALGLKPGDSLWTSPITFVASANCARYCGADVDFVDIDPQTGNMSVAELAEKLARAAVSGRLPKIVVPVHFAGLPCEMDEIHALSQRYGFKVIEDASHASGARYRGEPVGNCRYSDITVFSFHPVKIITTGEGGMALTNDAGLAGTMALLRSHGITRDPAQMEQEPEGPWYYQQIMLGFNYRMTDIQAALGLSQLKRLEAILDRRAELAARYHRRLAAMPLTLPAELPHARSSWHLYSVRLQQDRIGKSRREVFAAMRAADIGVNVHYIPVHLQPYYRRLGFRPGDFPAAERYYAEALSLPIHAALSDAEQDDVIKAVAEAIAP